MEPDRKTERLDTALVRRGILSGRDNAKEQIRKGFVHVNGKAITKPAYIVNEGDELTCTGNDAGFVGRGGLKLQKVLESGWATPHGKICMDVGASTGGFTDCMLRSGAKLVYAVDVGHAQLHSQLRRDARVVNLEGIDIRNDEKIASFLPKASVQFCSVDVSFIAVEKIAEALTLWLEEGAQAVILIKPQFETGGQHIGKNGVVKEKNVHVDVLKRVISNLENTGFRLQHLTFSPITGGEGNIEYLSVLSYRAGESRRQDVEMLVSEAHRCLRKSG